MHLFTIYDSYYRVEMMNDNCVCDNSLNYIAKASCDPKVFRAKCSVSGQGTPCPLSECALDKQRSSKTYIFIGINLIGFYWLMFFVSAFGHMVLAAIFATWYWTYDKRHVPFFTVTISIWRTVRFVKN